MKVNPWVSLRLQNTRGNLKLIFLMLLKKNRDILFSTISFYFLDNIKKNIYIFFVVGISYK